MSSLTGSGVLAAEMGKFDLAEAYKSILVDPAFWHLLDLHIDEPDGEHQFFTDVSLPFGLRLSPVIFS